MRGTRIRSGNFSEIMRFIPACAGNTQKNFVWFACVTVHPRVCGEHVLHIVQFLFLGGSSPRVRGTRPSGKLIIVDLGSSPRVRGTPFLVRKRSSKERFIPACAGNTVSLSPAEIFRKVHPRVCGEHFFSAAVAFINPGSSPRVRGTPLYIFNPGKFFRFIPACAGNTIRE